MVGTIKKHLPTNQFTDFLSIIPINARHRIRRLPHHRRRPRIYVIRHQNDVPQIFHRTRRLIFVFICHSYLRRFILFTLLFGVNDLRIVKYIVDMEQSAKYLRTDQWLGNAFFQKNNVKFYGTKYETYDIINDYLEDNQSDHAFFIVDLGEITKAYNRWRVSRTRFEGGEWSSRRSSSSSSRSR